MSWYRRLTNLVRRDRLGRDIDRELGFHLAELTDDLVAAGMGEAEARREARRRLGNPESLRERVHDVDVLVWLETLLADLRYGFRTLRTTPGFTLVAVLSLGLGIGANTAIFSLIDAVMLRSLPVRHPEELVQVVMGDGRQTFTNPLWEAIRDRQNALAGDLAFSDTTFDLSTGGEVRRTGGTWVSGDYFEVLGVTAAAGRVLQPADDVRGCPGVAVLSHAFWRRQYGGAEGVVGSSISLDGHPFGIVGVAEPGFSGIHVGIAPDVFAPLCALDAVNPGQELLDARSHWFVTVFGRLRPDQTLTEARAGLAAAAPAIYEATVPPHWTPEMQREYAEGTLSAEPAASGLSVLRSQYREALFALFVVVGIVLLIACANVAQLLLTRATARQHEMAVRLAIGSGRARLVRQLVTESLLLALLGAAAGVLFARWSSVLVVRFLSQGEQPVYLDLSLDLRVLGFAIAIATATGLLFGLVPAWRATRVDPQTAMHGSPRCVAGEPRQRLAGGLVTGQVALALVLVVAAGLLVGSFRRLATLDPGFQASGASRVTADFSNLHLSEERAATFPREVLDRVRAIPGVREAGASLLTPISGRSWNEMVLLDGAAAEGAAPVLVWFNGVTDGYLDTYGTRLLAGRDLTSRDTAGTPPVALVNEAVVRRFFDGDNPLGRRIRTDRNGSLGPPMEIVGVVEDAKYEQLDEETLPTAYVPLEQTELWSPSVEVTLRAEGGAAALQRAVTEAMRELDPRISVEITALDDQVAKSLVQPRLLATLSGFFGGLALLLAVVGLYGTVSYSVARRRNEIGIRVALGAARSGILRMVAGEAGRMVAAGVFLGSLVALAATRLVASFLYGVTASDPWTFATSALLLAAVAMGAALVPAWRAATVDPRSTLREE